MKGTTDYNLKGFRIPLLKDILFMLGTYTIRVTNLG